MSKFSEESIKAIKSIKVPRPTDITYDIMDDIKNLKNIKKDVVKVMIIRVMNNKMNTLLNKVCYDMHYIDIVMDNIIKKYKKKLPKTVLHKSPIHGNGIFALEDIPKGSFITFYPVHYIIQDSRCYVSQKVFEKYESEAPPDNIQRYFLSGPQMELYTVAGHYKIQEDYKYGHIINHSTNANAYYQLANGDLTNNIWMIISLKNIKKGEELFISYNF